MFKLLILQLEKAEAQGSTVICPKFLISSWQCGFWVQVSELSQKLSFHFLDRCESRPTRSSRTKNVVFFFVVCLPLELLPSLDPFPRNQHSVGAIKVSNTSWVRSKCWDQVQGWGSHLSITGALFSQLGNERTGSDSTHSHKCFLVY